MATVVNARDALLQASSPRIVPVALPTNVTAAWSQVSGTGKPSDYADVTSSAINSTVVVTGGGIVLSAGGMIRGGMTSYASGTGFFLGYSGGLYRFAVGSSGGHLLTWDGSNLNITGNITGNASVDIGGTARFNGSYNSGGTFYSLVANDSRSTTSGIIGYSATVSGQGVTGLTNSGSGVLGSASSGAGVFGISASGFGVYSSGKLGTDNSTMVANLNAQYLGGFLASAFAQASHSHSLNDIAAGTAVTFQFSTDGGANWTNILLKRI